jgi:cardiolipin synthase
MYIIENGVFLYTIANELIKKSKDGVKVYFMYDWVGSFRKSNSKLIRLMIKKGIDVSVFNPRGFNPLKSSTNFRSHEKNLIIDNKTCLYGSFNIADQYLTIKKNANIFKDLSFIISGEIVNSMSINFFANYFQFSNAKKKNKQITEKNLKNILQVYQADNNLKMQFISSAPNYTIKNIEDSLMQTFLNAKKRIRIINPFFCPTSVVLRALNIAGQNNIDVEIMLPGKKSEKN